MSLVVTGKVVSFDPARPVLDDGAVYVGDDGLIEAVQERSAAAPAGFEAAPRVDSGGVVYPGLIDLHNHVAYNCLSLWSPPGRTEPYTSRSQWPRDPSYKGDIHDPVATLGAVAGKALLKYVETKAFVVGVTAIQGSTKTGLHPYEGWLVRNIEFDTFGTKKKSVFQSALPIHEEKAYESAHRHLVAGEAYIYHLAEGSDHEKLVGEYTTVHDKDFLRPTFIAIHTNALGKTEYDQWGADKGSIVWSPFSNLWLYAQTTDVVAADKAGIRLCIGSDWAPSGSKNVLGELKVADMWNRTKLGGHFSDEELCR